MRRIDYSQDIQPLSSFRKNASSMVDRVRETGRPLVLTRNGQSAAVVVGADEFENLMERLELLEDIQAAREQVEAGEAVAHEDVKAYIRSRSER